MASRRASERVARRLALDPEKLADKLYAAKRRVYRRTLLELSRSLGYDVKRPTLAGVVDQSLRDEAVEQARSMVETFTADLQAAIDEHSDKSDADFVPAVETAMRSRQRKLARPAATTVAYGPYADAMVAGFRDLGSDARFDFGGHPDDADPACSICQVLSTLGPWSLAEVIAIGNPHPGCAQKWHPTAFDRRAMPTEPILGQTSGGIVGKPTLIERAGSRSRAVAFVESLRE